MSDDEGRRRRRARDDRAEEGGDSDDGDENTEGEETSAAVSSIASTELSAADGDRSSGEGEENADDAGQSSKVDTVGSNEDVGMEDGDGRHAMFAEKDSAANALAQRCSDGDENDQEEEHTSTPQSQRPPVTSASLDTEANSRRMHSRLDDADEEEKGAAEAYLHIRTANSTASTSAGGSATGALPAAECSKVADAPPAHATPTVTARGFCLEKKKEEEEEKQEVGSVDLDSKPPAHGASGSSGKNIDCGEFTRNEERGEKENLTPPSAGGLSDSKHIAPDDNRNSATNNGPDASPDDSEARIRRVSLPGAFHIPGPGLEEDPVIAETGAGHVNSEGSDSEGGYHWQSLPGAFTVNIPVASHPPNLASTSTAEAYEEPPAVLEAHVAPSEDEAAARMEEQRNSLIRERLLRNAPLVEAVNEMHLGDEESGQAHKIHVSVSRSRIIVVAIAIAVLAAAVTAIVVAITTDKNSSSSSTSATPPLIPPTVFPSHAPSEEPTDSPFLSPSAEPTTRIAQVGENDDFIALKGVLSTISSPELLEDPSSPQHLALHWLAYEDNSNVTAQDPERLIQRYIAAIFLFSTGDSANYPLRDVMVGDECTWNAPTVQGMGVPGFTCSEGGMIRSVMFGPWYRPLVGTFPEEVGYLQHLQEMGVANSNLIGSIPDSITSLRELVRVVFFNNGPAFGGTIPSFAAPNLSEIIITQSSYVGSIPTSIGISTKLVALMLGGGSSALTGTIPEFVADLPELAVLNIRYGTFTGGIPQSLGRNQSDLSLVSLVDIGLNGTIPNGLLSSQSLRGLYLQDNHLSGTIASEFGAMTNLKALYLHSNLLTSTIPPELGNIGLENLELGDNLLNGTVPTTLGNLVDLHSISLVGNADLHGDISFFCNMSIANLWTDCAVANPNLECQCCECCTEDSLTTCGQYPDSGAAWQKFVNQECCVKKQCGKYDCTGDQYSV